MGLKACPIACRIDPHIAHAPGPPVPNSCCPEAAPLLTAMSTNGVEKVRACCCGPQLARDRCLVPTAP